MGWFWHRGAPNGDSVPFPGAALLPRIPHCSRAVTTALLPQCDSQ